MKSEIAAAAASVAAQNLPVRPNYGCQVSFYHLAASVAGQNLPVRPNYGCQVSFIIIAAVAAGVAAQNLPVRRPAQLRLSGKLLSLSS
jgi:hypothetical protein